MDARIKIKIKVIPETLFLLYGLVRHETQVTAEKSSISQNQELYLMLGNRCKNYIQNPNGTMRTLSLWYHQAERIFNIIIENLDNVRNLGVFEQNQLEKLKNELHQKLL